MFLAFVGRCCCQECDALQCRLPVKDEDAIDRSRLVMCLKSLADFVLAIMCMFSNLVQVPVICGLPGQALARHLPGRPRQWPKPTRTCCRRSRQLLPATAYPLSVIFLDYPCQWHASTGQSGVHLLGTSMPGTLWACNLTESSGWQPLPLRQSRQN